MSLYFRPAGRFLMGPRRYRVRWAASQAAAWALSVVYAVGGGLSVLNAPYHDATTLPEAMGIVWIPAALVLSGLYLTALALMPNEFFEDSRVGRATRMWTGAATGAGARVRCLVSAAVFLGLSCGFWVLDEAVFGGR
jgi:hypothetical protein